jgi:hypothetical protein
MIKLVTYVHKQNIKGKTLLLLKQISEKYGEYQVGFYI